MRLSVASILTLITVQAALGQDTISRATEPQWPINPATYPRPTHPATRASGPIVIDGRPDDAAWREAPPITQFVQSRPDLGYPATEETVVRVLYDETGFYLSAICYDSRPDQLTVTSLERDFPPLDSDVLSFVLDPNLDRRNSFLFYVNPRGGFGDAQTFDDNRTMNYAWDGVAEVATELTDFGWTMEIAIPWTTIRFDGSEGSQDWGFNVQRRIRRINESSTWSPLDRREFQPKVSRAGTLTGFVGLKQGRNLRVEPYLRGSAALGSEGVGGNGDEVDAGLDFKYGITSSLTFDATYRTDFSHVEVDQLQVNLTRFPLFFPERRSFFIENSGMFEFGDGSPREYRLSVSDRDFTLFHTRRIGLASGGDVIPIVGGGRLTGSLGRFEVGALAMRTDAAGPETENFAVVRVRRRVLGASNVGFIMTNRNLVGEEGSPVFNRAWGVDGNFMLREYLLLSSYVAAAESSTTAGDLKDRLAARLSVGWRDGFWDMSALYRRLGEEFDPGLGFVRRRGINQYYSTFGVHSAIGRLALQEINPYVAIDYFTNLESVLETRSAEAGLALTFDDGSRSSLTYVHLFERLFEPFQVSRSDLSVGVGDYATEEVAFSHRTSPARTLSGSVSVSHGGYFDGTQTSYGVGGVWHPSPHLALEATLTRSEVTLPDGGLVADLAGLKLSVNPTTTLLLRAFVQYNGVSDEVVSNVRLRFIHAPLSDLYVVYSELRDAGGARAAERSLALKVTRLLAF